MLPSVVFATAIEPPKTIHAFNLLLDFANSRQRRLVAVLLPITLRGIERTPQINVPFVHCEGVAPASFHLGSVGFRICEPVTSVRDGAFDQGYDPADA